ncbi:MAG: hypothetical protein ACI9EW_002302 [Cellvibrionaceae bacterium]|jgi:hypothetical protein
MKKYILFATMLISAFLTVSCTRSDSSDGLESSDKQSADIEIVSPAFVLFYTEN